MNHIETVIHQNENNDYNVGELYTSLIKITNSL